MNKEKCFSEAAMKDNPKKKIRLEIRDGSVTKAKLADDVINAMGQDIASISKEKIDELFKNSDIIILPR